MVADSSHGPIFYLVPVCSGFTQETPEGGRWASPKPLRGDLNTADRCAANQGRNWGRSQETETGLAGYKWSLLGDPSESLPTWGRFRGGVEWWFF